MPSSQLVELYAHGLGVIGDARVEFGEGFNVITGETGAGKTLLLDALDLCLGGDAATSRHAVKNDMRAAALFIDRDGREVVLTREMSSSGRLRSTLDATTTSAEALRTLASELIVIHGQQDSLSLRNRSEILKIIDSSGAVDTSGLDHVRQLLRDARSRRAGFGGDESQRLRELDYLEYQIAELEAVRILSINELADTLSELTRLSELRDGQAALAEVLEQLDGDRDDVLLDRLAAVIERIPQGDAYEGSRESLRGVLEQARETTREMASLADPDVIDPGALMALDERVSALQHITRKYGGSLEVALSTLDDLHAQQKDRLDETSRLLTLDGDIANWEAQEAVLAEAARHDREVAASGLTTAIAQQLPRVALPQASLRFEAHGEDGSDARIVFSANPGLPEGPLQALASGGELSRVLLALSLETVHEDVVAVFDEVDAGVGGQVAQQIGDCLNELGRQQQVLAVTHLASVAAKADHHFVIDKSIVNGVATTSVRRVSGNERVDEIARMLAGDELTAESLALAQQLLETLR
jgi:DNA repair protein RecN (Recombination protein N)